MFSVCLNVIVYSYLNIDQKMVTYLGAVNSASFEPLRLWAVCEQHVQERLTVHCDSGTLRYQAG